MIRGLVIREAAPDDFSDIRSIIRSAFGRNDEADLVERLRTDGDVVVELIARCEQEPVGHILFSRLRISDIHTAKAVALAPLAVVPKLQRSGIGHALMENGHHILTENGEALSVVLGEPAYYSRFGYSHSDAEGFMSDYQGPYLQALRWSDDAPRSGKLVYAKAFSA